MRLSDSVKDQQVMLLSIFNASGRLIFGFSSDTMLRYSYFPHTHTRTFIFTFFSIVCSIHRVVRLYWFLLSGLGYILAFVLLITRPTDESSVWIATSCIGLCYGGIQSIFPTFLRDMFGARSFGKIFGLFYIAGGVGITVFGLMIGAIYDSHVRSPLAISIAAHSFVVYIDSIWRR